MTLAKQQQNIQSRPTNVVSAESGNEISESVYKGELSLVLDARKFGTTSSAIDDNSEEIQVQQILDDNELTVANDPIHFGSLLRRNSLEEFYE